MSSLNRQILALAVPTLATLIAEPLLILVDSALVGHLGAVPLAGLTLASTILTTLVGLCIFLSYATTASTARYFGAGRPAKALRMGIDGIWLALAIGALLALILTAGGPTIVSWFGPEEDVAAQAVTYLRASAWGLPGMLTVLAATGTVRGMLDAKTPLIVATSGALANIPLSYLLIYPAGLGIAGAGLGTAIAQTCMGLALGGVVVSKALANSVSLLPSGAGVLKSVKDAVPLIVRTACLRASIIVTVLAATSLGTEALAAHQVVTAVWNFAAFGLDSLAIAAQALVGQALGASAASRVRHVLNRCLVWGIWTGVGLGALVAATSGLIPIPMSETGSVRSLATAGLIVCGITMPLGAIAYMLDGVLIGAGDTRYLAWTMLLTLVAYLPVPLYLITFYSGPARWGFVICWLGYTAITMGVRAGTLYWRTRGEQWIILGESRD